MNTHIKNINSILTADRISELRRIREEKRNEGFALLSEEIGKAAVNELRALYSLFDERMLIWYGELYDPDIGGFYFSDTARDTDGFLPDLESTAQALKFFATQCDLPGSGEPITRIPCELSEKIFEFAYNLQDEDGFFYHPQWGKDITLTRRGRDLGWATQILSLKGKYKYPPPLSKSREKKSAVPDYLKDINVYKKWISERPFSSKSYPMGNLINSICGQICAAGPEFMKATVDYLDSIQCSDNGLWEKEISYDSVNGLMKIAISYPVFGGKLKHASAAFESSVRAILSDEPIRFACEFYNPWAAISVILRHGELRENEKDSMRSELITIAPELIRKTVEKMKTTYTGNGTFAYFSKDSGEFCSHSQGARVSLDGVWESDINGNGCSINGTLREMYGAFGMQAVPIFTEEDAKFVFDIMKLPITYGESQGKENT